jgi:preprotein translocase subunit SecA
MNEQRKVIYSERRRVLEGEDLNEQVQHMLTDVTSAYVTGATANGYAEDWDLEQLWTALKTLYPIGLDWRALSEDEDGEDLTSEELLESVLTDIRQRYSDREGEIDAMVGEGGMRELERRVVLSVLDRKWREHLYEMDYLKEGIGLRAMAQRDPLVEYQREGFDMFNGMLEGLREESVGFLFHLQVQATPPPEATQPAPSDLPGIARQQANGQTNGQAAANGNGHVQDAPPARQAPPPPPQPRSVDGHVPPALRGKGLGDTGGGQRLTYSGPGEDGAVEQRAVEDEDAAGGTRRERREQARAKAKAGRKRPRR